MNDPVRVRFAPSPTGFLHIGGVRTALYNWLYARHTGGKFILRVEDTDRERSTEEAVRVILDGLAWLGLDWDEGPVFQSKRMGLYEEAARRLEADGRAYRSTKGAEGKGEALVFRVPGRVTLEFDDAVLGKIRFEREAIEDFVLVRSTGMPTYNFACVVDDAEMGITHVVRGTDHVSNTPRQLLVYQALDLAPPTFAHIPMIVNEEGRKYSKRDGAVAVTDYAADGYLPEAMVNFLALLGWSPGGDREILPLEEIVKEFDLARVRKTPSQFDRTKFEWMNGKYIDALGDDEFIARAKPFMDAAGLDVSAKDAAWLARLAGLTKERVRTLKGLPDDTRFFFTNDLPPTEKAQKQLAKEDAGRVLEVAAGALGACEPFTAAALEPALRGAAKEAGFGFKKLAQTIRAAVTGTTISPPIFDTLELLGREAALARLRWAQESAA